MTDFHQKVPLGRTGLKVSRLGLGSSYPAPTSSYEEAFERGVNFFYWGSMRRDAMGAAIRGAVRRRREDLVVAVQSYARLGFFVTRSVERALRALQIDRAEVLILGWHNHPPSARVMDAAQELQRRGRIAHIALSSHKRTLFPTLLGDRRIAVWQVRYNAVHRGAEREVFPSLSGLPVSERPGVVTYTTTRWGHLCDPRRTPSGERTPTGTDCYRFAMSHPAVDVVVAGPGSDDQMKQALRALDLGTMNEEELAWMRRVGDHIYGKDRTSGMRDRV